MGRVHISLCIIYTNVCSVFTAWDCADDIVELVAIKGNVCSKDILFVVWDSYKKDTVCEGILQNLLFEYVLR